MPTTRKNGYLHGPENHGRSSERRVARAHGATPVRGSGAGYNKSDSVLSHVKGWPLRIESKATIKDSFSVKLSVLEKIQREALETDMYPAFTFSFVDAYGNPRPAGDWTAVPSVVFREMLDKLEVAGEQG